MSSTTFATQKANSYIHAEEIKAAKDEFIKKNGTLIGKIRTPFDGSINIYAY